MSRAKQSVLLVAYPIDGGVATHIHQLLKNLDKQKYAITLAATPSSDYAAICLAQQIPYFQISFTRSMNPLTAVRPWFELTRLCRQCHFDIIHLHSTHAGLIGRFAAALTGSRVVYTPHSPLYMQPHARLIAYLLLCLERFTMFLVDKVVFVSRSESERAVADAFCPVNKSVIIPNGVEAVYDKRAATTRPVITMVSRMEPQKRQQDLILAAGKVLKKFPKAEFRLVGDGSRRHELQSLVDSLQLAKVVHLLGQRSDVSQQFLQTTIAVQCSETEGMPYVVLEAMACGCPVIGTRVEGIVDVVKENETGLLYTKGDSDELADKILQLLSNTQVITALGRRAKQEIDTTYSVSRMIQSIEQLYGIL